MVVSFRRTDNIPKLSARKRFDRYLKESEHHIRDPEIDDQNLQKIILAWKNFHFDVRASADQSYYRVVEELVTPRTPSSREIEKFVVELAAYQEDADFPAKAGFFLSVLINRSDETDFIIQTVHLDEPIAHLGSSNLKNITILGDVGDYTGAYMKTGMINIKGNCESNLGYGMSGGLIVLDGNAEDSVGNFMSGGKITVGQSTGSGLGYVMTGGELVITGNVYGGVGDEMSGGSITIAGNVISIRRDARLRRLTVDRAIRDSVFIGHLMTGGCINLEGNYPLSLMVDSINGGEIYHKGKLIRKSE